MSQPSHRVYVPVSWAMLRTLAATGRLGPAPLLGHMVTDQARAELGVQGVTDDEELEYAVMTGASLDALAMLADEDPPRRLVVALDAARVEARHGSPDSAASAVLVPDEVPLKRVAAVLADADDALPDVVAARSGEEAAVERCLDHELGWYARQEVAALLGHAGDGPSGG